jgi:hypothetical protein
VKREAKHGIQDIMVEKIRNFRDLDVWKKGIEIVRNVYETVNVFPKQESYGLTSQM